MKGEEGRKEKPLGKQQERGRLAAAPPLNSECLTVVDVIFKSRMISAKPSIVIAGNMSRYL